MIKQYLADIITITRIVGSIITLSMPTLSSEFYIVYTYCGISDCLDGFIARKLHTESKFGSKLDTVSDLVFYSILIYKIWPILNELLPPYFFTIIWSITGIRIACYLYVMIRDNELASEHFILNKVTGLLLFGLPYLIKTKIFVYYTALLLLVAAIAALYEFKYHLTNKK